MYWYPNGLRKILTIPVVDMSVTLIQVRTYRQIYQKFVGHLPSNVARFQQREIS